LSADLRSRIGAALDAGRFDEADVLCEGLESEQRLHGMTMILSAYLRDIQKRLDLEQRVRAQAVSEAVRRRDAEEAKRLLDEKWNFHKMWHDCYIDFMAAIQSRLVTTMGEESLAEALHSVADSIRPMFDQMNVDLDTRVRTFAAAMRAHLGSVEVLEDDEKFTFVNDPCGSGGRLLREGYYEGEDALARVQKPATMTLGRTDFPPYCTHCPVWMAELHDEAYGSPLVLEPPKEANDPCGSHIYKDPTRIPVTYRGALGRA
jgi:hypothetical protein